MRRFMPLQWLLSFIFIVQMYLAMAVLGILFIIPTLINRNCAHMACYLYSRWVQFSLRILCGLSCEIRGLVPQDEVIIAAKHQSFLDILLLFGTVPRAKFVMKKELKWAPIFGWYAMKLGCVPVDRGKRGAAIGKMMQDVQTGATRPGQLIIYPQGTRVAPGEVMPYKIGTALLYQQLGQKCVPVATNVGVFWPKRGILRKPGRAVLTFLPIIETGLANREFMARIEDDIESASNQLLVEAHRQELNQTL